jgi:hypothetical protein
MKWERCGWKHLCHHVPWGNLRKTMLALASSEIQAKHLLKTGLECYYCNVLLSLCVLFGTLEDKQSPETQ